MSHKPSAFRTASLKRGVFAIPVIWSVLISAPSTHAQIPCAYEVTAIIQASECPPFGFPPTVGQAISEQVDGGLPYVVGHVQSCGIGPDVAFLWTPDQGIQLIPMPPGTTQSRAMAISGSRIVGTYDNPDLELGPAGFLYDFETDQFTSLGTLPGGNTSEARGINSASEIVGFWGDVVNGPFPQAFIWRDGEMIDIHPDFGTPRSAACDTNTAGLVTGWMGSSILSDARAFIWDNGKVTELPPIPGGFTSIGKAINHNGVVTAEGAVELNGGKTTVVRSSLWADNQMTDLGTLPDTTFTRARDINDQTRIVGYCHNQLLMDQTAFVWEEGVMTALNDLIPPELGLNIKNANAINQAGQIAATAVDEFSDVVAVLLTPITGTLGDLNGDCTVGVADLLMLLSNWGPCENCSNCPADLDNNCVVGVSDLLILLANWG